jgi:UDP-N-acetylmuramoylalanine--D-glutamate ligase
MKHGARQTVCYGTKPSSLVRQSGTCLSSDLAGDPGPILDTSALRLTGDFQAENVMAAFAAASLVGGSRHPVALALTTSTPLPFRLQLAAAVAGRRIYNNSVSTQVESTLSALRNLPGCVHWVGGGKSKDNRYLEPGRLLSDSVTTAHLFGSSAPRLGPVMSANVTTTVHDGLEAALDAAWTESKEGDTILFSPAFASFDQFPNFALRAARFETWVRKLQAHYRISPSSTADGSGPAG